MLKGTINRIREWYKEGFHYPCDYTPDCEIMEGSEWCNTCKQHRTGKVCWDKFYEYMYEDAEKYGTVIKRADEVFRDDEDE